MKLTLASFGQAARLALSSLRGIALALCVIAPSSALAQATDVRSYFPKQLTMSPKGVNLQTGRLTYAKTDVSIGPLSLVRTWGDVPSHRGASHIFGTFARTPSYVTGWGHNFSQGVEQQSSGGNYLVVSVDSKQYKFALLALGGIIPWDRSAMGALLVSTATGYVMTNQAGTVYTFTTMGSITVLVSAKYADGSQVDYSYNGNVQPRSIISNRGYALIIDYDGNANIAAACGFNMAVQYVSASSTCAGASLKATYSYSADGTSLTSVTDTQGDIVQYIGYATMGGPLCITLPNSATCELQNSYGPQPGDDPLFITKPDMVRKQVTATGDVWTYVHDVGENPIDVPVVQGRPRYTGVEMVDPQGGHYNLRFDRGVLVDAETPAGLINYKYPEITFTVQTPFSLMAAVFEFHVTVPSYVTYPEGNMEYYLYNRRGETMLFSRWPKGSPSPVSAATGSHIISQSDPDLAKCCVKPDLPVIPPGAITIGQAFLPDYFADGSLYPTGCGAGPADAKRCNKPIARIDERGNQTDYSYDPAHGGILTETGPAVTSINAAGVAVPGVRPQTRYTYAQAYAWIKNAAGAYVQASSPIWVLTSKRFCKTGAASGAGCAIAGDEVITTYEYGPNSGPNNLLLRGTVVDSAGLKLRTCMTYDWQGNKISETKPMGTSTSCP